MMNPPLVLKKTLLQALLQPMSDLVSVDDSLGRG